MCKDSKKLKWLGTMWQALGIFLKFCCNRLDVYVFNGNSSTTKALHMKTNNGMDQKNWRNVESAIVVKPLGMKSPL
jgi:hypothetical protein